MKTYKFRCLTLRGGDYTYIVESESNKLALVHLIAICECPSDQMAESAKWIVTFNDHGTSEVMLVSWSELCIWAGLWGRWGQ